MRSTETFPITDATSRMARSASAGPWRLPSLWSTEGSKDCTPIETRFTPASRQAAARAASADSGFASIVTSAPRGSPSARAASTTRAIAEASQSDGVPPPRKSVAQGRPAKAGARRRISSITAAA